MQTKDTKITIPKLFSDSSNWVIYWNRLTYSLNAHGLSAHLTEDEPFDEHLAKGDVRGLTPEACWRKGQGIVMTLIGTSIPDDVFNHISAGGTAREVWDALRQDYEDHTLMTTVDLVQWFRTKQCEEKDNVCTHFQELSDLHNQLAVIGKTVDDDNFTATLLASLPPSYNHACTLINSSVRLGSVALMPAIAREIVLKEYERQVARDLKKGTQDEAFSANAQKKKKRDVECHNCHKCGHFKVECWAKGGGQEGQGPKRKGHAKEGTAAVTKPQLEAWAVLKEVNDG